MLEGTWAAGAGAEEGGGSGRKAGAVVVLLTGAGVAAEAVVAAAGLAAAEEGLFAAGGVWDEEALPCDWVEKAAEAWKCARLRLHSSRKGRRNITYN